MFLPGCKNGQWQGQGFPSVVWFGVVLIKGLLIKSNRLDICPMRANQDSALLIMMALHLSTVRSSAWQPAMKSERWARVRLSKSPTH